MAAATPFGMSPEQLAAIQTAVKTSAPTSGSKGATASLPAPATSSAPIRTPNPVAIPAIANAIKQTSTPTARPASQTTSQSNVASPPATPAANSNVSSGNQKLGFFGVSNLPRTAQASQQTIGIPSGTGTSARSAAPRTTPPSSTSGKTTGSGISTSGTQINAGTGGLLSAAQQLQLQQHLAGTAGGTTGGTAGGTTGQTTGGTTGGGSVAGGTTGGAGATQTFTATPVAQDLQPLSVPRPAAPVNGAVTTGHEISGADTLNLNRNQQAYEMATGRAGSLLSTPVRQYQNPRNVQGGSVGGTQAGTTTGGTTTGGTASGTTHTGTTGTGTTATTGGAAAAAIPTGGSPNPTNAHDWSFVQNSAYRGLPSYAAAVAASQGNTTGAINAALAGGRQGIANAAAAGNAQTMKAQLDAELTHKNLVDYFQHQVLPTQFSSIARGTTNVAYGATPFGGGMAPTSKGQKGAAMKPGSGLWALGFDPHDPNLDQKVTAWLAAHKQANGHYATIATDPSGAGKPMGWLENSKFGRNNDMMGYEMLKAKYPNAKDSQLVDAALRQVMYQSALPPRDFMDQIIDPLVETLIAVAVPALGPELAAVYGASRAASQGGSLLDIAMGGLGGFSAGANPGWGLASSAAGAIDPNLGIATSLLTGGYRGITSGNWRPFAQAAAGDVAGAVSDNPLLRFIAAQIAGRAAPGPAPVTAPVESHSVRP